MQPHTESVAAKGRDGVLRPYAGVLVTVTTQAGALATLFSDNGITTQANPITSDANGMYQFYAADGLYTVTLVGDGTTLYSYKVLLEDIGDPNAINATTLTATGAASLSSTLSVAGQTTVAALTATGQTSLGGAVGAEAFRAVPVASAISRLESYGSATGSSPRLMTNGTESTAGLVIATPGTGSVRLFTNWNTASSEQFRIAHTASAVNYVQASGAPTGSAASIGVRGSDTNVASSYSSQGSGTHFFYTNSGTAVQFSIAHTATSVNYWQTSGNTTGNRPSLTIQGMDTNPGGAIYSKGTGDLVLGTNGSSGQFVVAHTAASVNFAQITGSATGNGIVLAANGTDAGVDIRYRTKGSNAHYFDTNSTTTPQLVVTHTPSAINYLQITGAATGVALVLAPANAGDANISSFVRGRGTGLSGLQDSAGTTRIAVNTTGIGFFNTAPIAKPAASGSRGGNAALASLLTQLAALGLITDSTTA